MVGPAGIEPSEAVGQKASETEKTSSFRRQTLNMDILIRRQESSRLSPFRHLVGNRWATLGGGRSCDLNET